jgi:hypothetical protein
MVAQYLGKGHKGHKGKKVFERSIKESFSISSYDLSFFFLRVLCVLCG